MLPHHGANPTVFLRDSESLSILLRVINESSETDDLKISASQTLKFIFNKIVFALCTPAPNSIVCSSVNPKLDIGVASPTFNSLAYLEKPYGGGGSKHTTYSFYGGLNKFSRPNCLIFHFKFDLSFNKYRFSEKYFYEIVFK